MISEVGAAAIGRRIPSSETPVGPPEFRGLKSTDIPDEDRSLYEHYLARFQRLADRGSRSKTWWYLLWEAEDALRRRTVPPTQEEREAAIALVLNRADEKALIRTVIDDHEGVDAFKVHLALRVPLGWVEHIREQNGRDPDLGEQRPVWKDFDAAGKRAIVAQLEAGGMTQRQVARKLGIGVRTVRTFWPARAGQEAA